MTAQEIRELSDPELTQKVTALKQQLFHLRVQAKLGRLEQGLELRVVRRDIARCLTIQREKASAVKASAGEASAGHASAGTSSR